MIDVFISDVTGRGETGNASEVDLQTLNGHNTNDWYNTGTREPF